MKRGFHGGAGTVTGSRGLVEHRGRRLLMDCGLFQGWKPLLFAPREVDAVLLNHAHLGHAGALPLLRQGFTGSVLATPTTVPLPGRTVELDA